jgi:diacylglycerol kinase family enzyme
MPFEFPAVQLSVTYLSGDSRRVLIAANPCAGARSSIATVQRLVDLLREQHYDAQVFVDIQKLAAESHAAMQSGDLRAVVAAGGDGTVGLVVNHTPVGVPVMVLPLGTENLLAKYLGVATNAQFVCQTLCAGVTVRLDAGRAGDRIFLLMVSCGFDAEVVRRLHRDRRGNIRHISYAKPILASIRTYQYPELRIYCDAAVNSESQQALGHVELHHARWAFVANLPRYAAGLRIVPQADGRDGLLDVCTFREGSFWNGLVYLGGVILGQHHTWADCTTIKARHIRIESDVQVPYQLDGDPGGFLPLDIEVLPQRLTLVVPQRWADLNGVQPIPDRECK